MVDLSIVFQDVSFSYDKAAHPLFNHLSLHLTKGWTGIVGANGVGKSTILKLATGELKPLTGHIAVPEFAIYCPQRTDTVPDHLHALVHAMDGSAFEIKGRLGVEDDWADRWATLSHGERKRAQIAVALWQEPQVLAVDEPTNHLDIDARNKLFTTLTAFQGVGILVCHDREFLDELCHQCLFVEPPNTILRPGNYTQGLQQSEKEEIYAVKQRQLARLELSRIKREATKRRDAASKADIKRSKRRISRKDHDAKGKIDQARVTGKDGIAGKQLNQLSGRLSQAQVKLQNTKVKKKYAMGIWVSGEKSKRNTLFSLNAGSLSLGRGRWLHFPDLQIKPDDRVALTGPNGSGKSTMIDHVMRSLNIGKDRIIYMPQEIDIQESQDIMVKARMLPNERLGQMMTVVSRLGSRPHRLLESIEPSPGEIRKILLATGIANIPHLIVMDEPTNHLDLPSIECLEHALTDCPCGLLLASHDQRFLDVLARQRWHISEDGRKGGDYILKIQ
ncbi:ABC transporter related [Desulfosarcina cetonica]|uniref:ATP-binding cassette domain-containing protein n=1 Tax=Desulfosarcina cetonica TaxID=90730 RepID=UPI0006D265E9|nr:ATP-binding cassette domain-containing protein [Desulfosarcina cetonica]VTR67001.1 ABC transporter related [Desulfosarcina cetonica]